MTLIKIVFARMPINSSQFEFSFFFGMTIEMPLRFIKMGQL